MKQLAFLSAVAAAALSLTGCDEQRSTRVCMGQNNQRADDWNCQNSQRAGGGGIDVEI